MSGARKQPKQSKQLPAAKRRTIGVVLCVVAVLLLVLAWQCISTEQFKLYQSKRDSYVSAAAEYAAYQQESANTGNSAMYGNLAQKWMTMADSASRYLLTHTIGAISLVIVSLLAMILGVRALIAAGREEKRLPTPDEIRSQGPVFRLGAGSPPSDDK